MTIASRILGLLAKLPPPTTGDVSVERNLTAKMGDGIVLLADRWYPTGASARTTPVVLLRTPYGRRQSGMVGRLFAERGYQVVIQSCRGTFGSGGEWEPFRNEQQDGRATLDWITNQPWFDGKLTTFGPSYLGLTQWAVARGAPDYLRAMALDVTASNFRDAVVYPSGGFALGSTLAWLHQLEYQERGGLAVLHAQLTGRRALRAGFDILPVGDADAAVVGRHVPFFQDWLIHEKAGDSWWDPVSFGPQLEDMPPSTFVGGWYDMFLPSQLHDFQALRAAGRSARLTIGPWSHASPGVMATSLRDGLEWFDGHFSEVSTRRPRNVVRVFVMGTRRWIEFPDWPPPADKHVRYLGAEGKLGRSPSPDAPPDRYRYDPADPTPAIGGPSLNWRNTGSKDQRQREARADVLTYTSEGLTEDLTVIGPVNVDLHLRSSLAYTDFYVRLCDVSPQGRSKNLSDGLVRLRPGDVTESADRSFLVRINMWPTAHTFKRGHRLRLQVSSGAHPLLMRNTGTGEPLISATRLCAADQEVFHDPEHPSALELPVTRI